MREKILVVEDEAIIAKNIQNRLKKLGYSVPKPVSTGQEAIKMVSSSHPDLVVMDIVLKGDVDGVDTAKKIRARYDIPVVYLTAHSDDKIIERAKFTEPFGYVLKPFEIEGLHSAIQVALHKHRAERELKRKKRVISNTLKNIGYAVFSVDKEGLITYMNPKAETLSGIKENEASGKSLSEVLKFYFGESEYDPVTLVKKLRTKGSAFRFHCYIGFKNTGSIGEKFLVNFVPSRDGEGKVNGSVLVFRTEAYARRANLDFISANTPETNIRKQAKVISLVFLASTNIVADGVGKRLEPEKDIELVGVFLRQTRTIEFMERKQPDVLLVDTSIPALKIKEFLNSTKKISPQTKVLLLIHSLDDRVVIDALSAGATGFLAYKTENGELSQAIRFVSRDEIWGDLRIMKKILGRLSLSETGRPKLVNMSLTNREKEIARLVANGYRNKVISTKLFISEDTVKKHLNKIFKKLGIKNRLQLALEFNSYL